MVLGQVYSSNSCGYFVVKKIESFKRVHIEFVDTGYCSVVRTDSALKGTVKDKLMPSVHGVGFVGDGEFKTSESGKNNKAYLTWQRMLGRCYDSNNPSRKNYQGCTVDPRWHNFQNFSKWFYENYPSSEEEIHLDKDMIKKGNKVYCPEFCSFVTLSQNVVHAKAKEFKAVSPSGQTVEIYNLEKFCRENGLNKANMHKVLTGKHKSCKGWTAVG
jgi:hypothetical protein